MTESDVFAEDKLFATLDPVTRSTNTPNGTEILVTDTVGFVNKLPHDLVDAFRSTLEEAKFADVLVHVVDASSDQSEMQFKVALDVLSSLGAGEKKRILALNKIDIVEDNNVPFFDNEKVVEISAVTGEGLDKLYAAIEEILQEGTEEIEVIVPYANGALSNFIHQNAEVISQEFIHEERNS